MAWLRPFRPGRSVLAAAVGLPPLALALVWLGRRRRWPQGRSGDASHWAGIGRGLLGLHLGILTAPALLWPYLLAWPALLVWLWTVRSPWSAGLLATLTLLLGAGWRRCCNWGRAPVKSGWLRYGGSGAALAGTFGWAPGPAGRSGAGGNPPWLNARRARWGLRGLGGAGLALLAAQAAFGDEGAGRVSSRWS